MRLATFEARARVLVLFCSAVLLHCTWPAAADMYDVVEDHKIAPSTCTHGCAPWSSFGTASAALFAEGAAGAAAAGASCAQPGRAVNARTLGAWCFCSNSTFDAAAPPDPEHPLDGETFGLFNIYDSEDLWVSFAYSAAPPGEVAAGGGWIRALYPAQTDAMPLKFEAVPTAPHTYLLYNEWPGYQAYIGKDDDWLRANASRTDALAITFVATPGDSTYLMVDHGTGLYISFCTSACDDSKWLRAYYSSQSSAMVVKLVPIGPPIQADWGYCRSTNGVPEQINVQLGGEPTSVVLAFVTFEAAAPTDAPVARIGTSATTLTSTVTGVVHTHTTAVGDKTYYMHFVRVTNLTARQRYFYQVKSNGKAKTSMWSDVHSFRAGYDSGVTRVDVWGDMGVYQYNNMGNVFADCANGTAADLAIQMGDHAYNMGESDESRGDAYMSAWQPTLANCPWLPIVGNHEYYDGAELGRFLAQTWGGRVWPDGDRSTADHALGALLSKGNQHGVGLHGASPSNTSRFFSADFGLIHFIALDLNLYYGVDPCGDPCREAQLAWLKEDLVAANKNRDAVPWVIAMSHYPFYCTGCYAKQLDSAFYESNEAELYGNLNRTAAGYFADSRGGKDPGNNRTLQASSDASIKDLMPIISDGKVDMYLAGHWHYYESLWPSSAGTTGTGGAVIQKSFVNPPVPVHVTTGNGGPPGADNFREDCPGPDCGSIPSSRAQSTAFGYGRLTAFNNTHLQFQQYANANMSLVDEFFIVRT